MHPPAICTDVCICLLLDLQLYAIPRLLSSMSKNKTLQKVSSPKYPVAAKKITEICPAATFEKHLFRGHPAKIIHKVCEY